MTYPITKRQFRLFKSEILRLSRLWKMSGWSFDFLHVDKADPDGEFFASEQCLPGQRLVVFRLTTKCDTPITDEYILDTARHELIHALTEPLLTLADKRYVSRDEVDQASHEVLQRLMVLLPR